MNQKELGEIRRRIRPDRSSITHIYGCYVNGGREIISYIDESVGLMSAEENEKYFTLLRKSLSGGLGRRLLELSFATKQVMESPEYSLLSALRRCELQDAALREEFYKAMVSALDMDGENYLILLAFDAYDVPYRGRDGERQDSGNVFKYLLCSICPVKAGKAQLGYVPEEKRFHNSAIGQIVAQPELGFMFPCFDDRAANIYSALFYTRGIREIHQEFIDSVFRTEVPISPAKQKDAFGELLTQSLERDCSMELVQAVHEQLSDRIALHKESRDPEPLSLSPKELGDIMADCGAKSEQAEQFCELVKDELGDDARLMPENIIGGKRLEIATPQVKLSLEPKDGHLVSSRIIDGHKYILINADSGLEINGIAVDIIE